MNDQAQRKGVAIESGKP